MSLAQTWRDETKGGSSEKNDATARSYEGSACGLYYT